MAAEGVVLFTDAEVKKRVQEGLAKVIKKVLKRADPRSARPTAGESVFDPKKVRGFVDDVCGRGVEFLKTDYKYVVTCFVSENKGGAWHTSSTGYADEETDGSITLMWSTDRLHCALHCHAFLL